MTTPKSASMRVKAPIRMAADLRFFAPLRGPESRFFELFVLSNIIIVDRPSDSPCPGRRRTTTGRVIREIRYRFPVLHISAGPKGFPWEPQRLVAFRRSKNCKVEAVAKTPSTGRHQKMYNARIPL